VRREDRPGVPDRRWTWILAAFVAAHVPFLLFPLGGVHAQRQADTFAIARNLVVESFDPLRPRVDARGDASGVTGMEFPLFPLLVAAGFLVAGSTPDWIAKAVALLCSGAAWLPLVAVLRRRAGLDARSVAFALFVNPLLFLHAASVIPDGLALLLAAVAIERHDAYLTTRRTGTLAVSAAALALAALVRPYFLAWGLPMLVAWLRDVVRERRVTWAPVLLGVAVWVPIVLWYFVWSPRLVETHGLPYFFTGGSIGRNLADAADPGWLFTLLRKVLVQETIGVVGLAFFAAGLVALLRRRPRPDASLVVGAFGVPALALVVLTALVGDPLVRHSYYMFALVPATVGLTAGGFAALRRLRPRAFVAVGAAACLATLGVFAHRYRVDYHYEPYRDVLAEVRTRTREDELFVVEGKHHAFHLHPIRRRGWVLPTGSLGDAPRMQDLVRRGARWVLRLDGDRYALVAADEFARSLAGAPPR
jgi:hypothetical protein